MQFYARCWTLAQFTMYLTVAINQYHVYVILPCKINERAIIRNKNERVTRNAMQYPTKLLVYVFPFCCNYDGFYISFHTFTTSCMQYKINLNICCILGFCSFVYLFSKIQSLKLASNANIFK